jgi:hypothetical protein
VGEEYKKTKNYETEVSPVMLLAPNKKTGLLVQYSKAIQNDNTTSTQFHFEIKKQVFQIVAADGQWLLSVRGRTTPRFQTNHSFPLVLMDMLKL